MQLAKNESSYSSSSRAWSDVRDRAQGLKVFIPYDGSECARIALDELRRAGLPPALDAVVAVTGVWLPSSPAGIARAVNERRLRVVRAGASSFAPASRDHEEQRFLSREATRRISSKFPLSKVRTDGLDDTATIASEILVKARQRRAQLIIVGSTSDPSPHEADDGGPALRIGREAHCSVRIARASGQTDDSPLRIILAVDGSASTPEVVDAVADRVWPRGSELYLVAAREDGPRHPRGDAEITATLNAAARRMRAQGFVVSVAFRDGKPTDALRKAARELNADCIFIGARGFSRARDEGPGLSQTAEALISEARCSVEVVRAKYLGGLHIKPAA